VSFLHSLLTTSSEWAALSEYGVGAGDVASPITLSQAAPNNPSASDIDTLVQSAVSAWGTPTGREIFVIYFPTSSGMSGTYYHSALSISGASSPVQFAVISGYTDVATGGYVQFHEISEAATDPLVGQGGFSVPNHDLTTWSSLGTGTELADMCVLTDFGSSVDLGVGMKADWLNSHVLAGADPCPPAGTNALPSFGGFPVLKDTYTTQFVISNSAFSNANAAVRIPPGASATVQIQLFSFGPLPADMTLQIVQLTPLVTVSLDVPHGKNGDIVNLTITAPATSFPASSPYAAFAVVATVIDSNGTVHTRVFPGLVIN
jgi:hypothetical protein